MDGTRLPPEFRLCFLLPCRFLVSRSENMNTCRISSLNNEPLHISSTQSDFRQTTCGTLCYRNIRLHREPGNSAYCNLPFTTYLRILWDQFAEQLNLEISQVRVHRERLHSLLFLLLSVPFRKLQIVSNKHRNYPVLTLIKHSAASILSFSLLFKCSAASILPHTAPTPWWTHRPLSPR